MLKRERERSAAQRRWRNSFFVFSCGVAEWRLGLGAPSFSVESGFFEVGRPLSQANGVTDRQTKPVAKNATQLCAPHRYGFRPMDDGIQLRFFRQEHPNRGSALFAALHPATRFEAETR